MKVTNNITQHMHPQPFFNNHRIGTAKVHKSDLYRILGQPVKENWSKEGLDGADKVHAIWEFTTPRGMATVKDYWWNGDDEWSISANSRKAGMWLASHLRNLGISATCRTPFGGSYE